MEIEKHINDAGEFRAFSFPNSFFYKKDVRDFVNSLPKSNITFFTGSFGVEVFCEFTYQSQKFSVLEPYGDNSHYDIVCEEPDTDALADLYKRFLTVDVSKRIEKRNKYRLFFLLILIVVTFSWLSTLTDRV